MAIYHFRDPYRAAVHVELTPEEEDLVAAYYRGDTPESAFLLRKDQPGLELFFAPVAGIEIGDEPAELSSRLDVPAQRDDEPIRAMVRMSTETYDEFVRAVENHRGGEFEALDITPIAVGS
jgi:hypothetical protein